MRVHVVQHVDFEGPGAIASWLDTHGHQTEILRPYAGQPLPDAGDVDWLIVMGGPMGVRDDASLPWLTGEKRFLRACLDADAAVLGICLGAQLIADALGAAVYANGDKEIGWLPIEAVDEAGVALVPAGGVALHWHGDTFDLPPGARHLVRSAACRHQAFDCGPRVVGLQYHLEMQPAGLADLARACAAELAAGGPCVQSETEILAPTAPFAANHAALHRLLDRLATQAHA